MSNYFLINQNDYKNIPDQPYLYKKVVYFEQYIYDYGGQLEKADKFATKGVSWFGYKNSSRVLQRLQYALPRKWL